MTNKLQCDRDYTYSERIGKGRKWLVYKYRTVLLDGGIHNEYPVYCPNDEVFYKLLDHLNVTDSYRKYYSV